MSGWATLSYNSGRSLDERLQGAALCHRSLAIFLKSIRAAGMSLQGLWEVCKLLFKCRQPWGRGWESQVCVE